MHEPKTSGLEGLLPKSVSLRGETEEAEFFTTNGFINMNPYEVYAD